MLRTCHFVITKALFLDTVHARFGARHTLKRFALELRPLFNAQVQHHADREVQRGPDHGHAPSALPERCTGALSSALKPLTLNLKASGCAPLRPPILHGA